MTTSAETLPNSATKQYASSHKIFAPLRPCGEQDRVLAELRDYANKSPSSDVTFFKYGWVWNGITAYSFSLIAWRSAFRGFSLSKFGKGRVASLFTTNLGALNICVFTETMCHAKLKKAYREEDPAFYATMNGLAQAIGNITSGFLVMGFSFCLSQRYGLIPITDYFLQKKHRKETWQFMKKSIRPYGRTLAIAYVASVAVSTMVGFNMYDDSRKLLERMGYDYITYKSRAEIMKERGQISSET